ncbi:MAG TPA: alpha/beta hydrolase-fold protein [Polyangia bacterium]|nr:alpha/beta hydrolase-fold protein [Polyangia bacterium]
MKHAPLITASIFLLTVGCGGGSHGGATGSAGAMAAAGANGGSTAGANGTAGAAAGTAGALGSAGSGTAGATTGAAGADASAGSAGATGSAGAATDGATTDVPTTPGLTDPGSDGDGDFMIGPKYTNDPASTYVTGTPIGHQFSFVMPSSQSTIYPGRNGVTFNRTVWVYIPQQYVPGTKAPFIVVQDGDYAVWFGDNVPHPVNTKGNLPGTANLPRILDNYIAAKKLPRLVVIFPDNGGGDGGDSERGLEYDTVSGVFAQFVETEVLPKVISEAQSQLSINLALTSDPQGRGTLGGSSGGAASFSMAWWHPELFSRIITFSGTFVKQASPEDPMFPHGCWCYHDFDPYNAAAPNGLIVMAAANKPIRHWLEVGTNDMGMGGGPSTYRDFELANQRMAASYKLKGYHYHFDLAQGAGHLDGNAVAQTLPSALLYVWRGYPID